MRQPLSTGIAAANYTAQTPGHRPFGNSKSELLRLRVDFGSAPIGILIGQSGDQIPEFHSGSSDGRQAEGAASARRVECRHGCRSTTVSGLTMSRASDHRDHKLRRAVQGAGRMASKPVAAAGASARRHVGGERRFRGRYRPDSGRKLGGRPGQRGKLEAGLTPTGPVSRGSTQPIDFRISEVLSTHRSSASSSRRSCSISPTTRRP